MLPQLEPNVEHHTMRNIFFPGILEAVKNFQWSKESLATKLLLATLLLSEPGIAYFHQKYKEFQEF